MQPGQEEEKKFTEILIEQSQEKEIEPTHENVPVNVEEKIDSDRRN